MKLSQRLATLVFVSATMMQTTANASALFGWRVTNVEWNDALNIRKYPSNRSQILTAYQNGVRISLTGRCTKNLHLDDFEYPKPWILRHAVRYRWCEVWVNPAGDENFTSGWVYGKYIEPDYQ